LILGVQRHIVEGKAGRLIARAVAVDVLEPAVLYRYCVHDWLHAGLYRKPDVLVAVTPLLSVYGADRYSKPVAIGLGEDGDVGCWVTTMHLCTDGLEDAFEFSSEAGPIVLCQTTR
jgi:hypothetical protein